MEIKMNGHLMRFFDGLEREGGSRDLEDYNHIYKYKQNYEDIKKKCEIDYKCCCGHKIEKLRFVQNTINGRYVEIGSCCIYKFGVKRICQGCGKEHSSRRYDECKKCRQTKILFTFYIKRDLDIQKLPTVNKDNPIDYGLVEYEPNKVVLKQRIVNGIIIFE